MAEAKPPFEKAIDYLVDQKVDLRGLRRIIPKEPPAAGPDYAQFDGVGNAERYLQAYFAEHPTQLKPFRQIAFHLVTTHGQVAGLDVINPSEMAIDEKIVALSHKFSEHSGGLDVDVTDEVCVVLVSAGIVFPFINNLRGREEEQFREFAEQLEAECRARVGERRFVTAQDMQVAILVDEIAERLNWGDEDDHDEFDDDDDD